MTSVPTPRRLTEVSSDGRLAQALSVLRTALGGLFDQRKPFGRLALVHCLQAAGTTFVTISLAGSLFFSISPDAAESKVLLYLLITIAPFAVVGPALSPLLDRGRQARRSSVAIANVGGGDGKKLTDIGSVFVNGAQSRAGIPMGTAKEQVAAGAAADAAAFHAVFLT